MKLIFSEQRATSKKLKVALFLFASIPEHVDFLLDDSSVLDWTFVYTGSSSAVGKRQWQPLFEPKTEGDKSEENIVDPSAQSSAKRTRFFADSPPSSASTVVQLGQPQPINLLGSTRVTTVGELSPVEDFNAMIEDHDPKIADQAINEIQGIISKLVKSAVTGAMVGKAVNCVKAFRIGCVKQEEPQVFNRYFDGLMKESVLAGRVSDFPISSSPHLLASSISLS